MRPQRLLRFLLTGALVAAATLCSTAVAHADSVAYADDGAFPWASGATAMSPLELFMSKVLRELTGNPNAEGRCEGQNDWETLAREREFDPSQVLGFVTWYHRGESGHPSPGALAEFAPNVCTYLQRFAAATPKPTKCQPLTTVRETVPETETVPVRVRRTVTMLVPVRVATTVHVGAGESRRTKTVVRRVMKRVARTMMVTELQERRVSRVVERQAPGPLAPCYTGRTTEVSRPTETYWAEYDAYAFALNTLAHEAMHLEGKGIWNEWDAQCQAMQHIRYVAQRFGATPDDAQAVARYVYEVVYPNWSGTEYWTPGCVANGPLDLSPNDGLFP